MTDTQKPPHVVMYGPAISQAIASGNLQDMQEMAVVSNYLQRVTPVDQAWSDAHKQLVDAISAKLALDVTLQPQDIISTGIGGVSVIKNQDFSNALRTLMTSNMAGLYIKLSLS